MFRLFFVTTSQIWMYHITLNGAGTNNGDLNDEVVEFCGLQAWQHRHLRPAFNLEGAKRIGLLDHFEGCRIIIRHGSEIVFLPIPLLQHVEAALHAGKHAKCQAIHLHELHDIDIVLVPFDDLAIIHGGGFDRHQLVQPVMGQNEAARMLAVMARCADKLVGQFKGKFQATILHIEVQFLHLLFTHPLAPAPDLRREEFRQVFRQAQNLADIAQRPTPAITGDDRTQCGLVATIGIINPLDDLLTPLMFEIHIDVRRFAPFFRNETFKQKIDLEGINGGDAEHVADNRIGCRAASLAENIQ